MAGPDPFVGATLGELTIEQTLGQGGVGAVDRARDDLGRTVAGGSIRDTTEGRPPGW